MCKGKKTLLSRVRRDLHKAVKLVAAEAGVSMNKVVEEALAKHGPIIDMLKVIGG